jgi:hypothetical protein
MQPSGKHLADPFIGTWKLDVAHSTFSPGPPPKSLTVRIERSGQGEKTTAHGVNAEGKATQSEFTANYDEQDHRISGSATADTVSLKHLNPKSTQRTDKKEGKIVETRTRKVSNDGKTLTVAFVGNYPNGKRVNHQLVFEKQ